ncbi:hypothetical protein SpCBS45565_g01833 [Spizellomyces sp. 'palustris']|nr:hypothetical protein SpCBS45565_g01833 [Spizellomyces sp. 'palustris']
MVADLAQLDFQIAACSGYDEECPPEQLLLKHHGPLVKGWQSERFCNWPQALVMRFSAGNSRIRKIEVLVHHFKIPTRLEFYIGRTVTGDELPAESNLALESERRLDDGNPTVVFVRLGYVSLNDGVQIGFKARELKSVHVDAEGEYLKVMVHKCYVNPLNLYNQVGIIGVNVFGEPQNVDHILKTLSSHQQALLGLDPLTDADLIVPRDNANAAFWGLVNETATNRRIPPEKDLAFEIYHDDEVMKIISGVAKAKDTAVKEERFADAKMLKSLLDKCKTAGEEVAKLQVTKSRAVQVEDYDTAAEMKADIDAVKRALAHELSRAGLDVQTDGSVIRKKEENETQESTRTQTRLGVAETSLPPSPPSSKTASPPKPDISAPSPRRAPPVLHLPVALSPSVITPTPAPARPPSPLIPTLAREPPRSNGLPSPSTQLKDETPQLPPERSTSFSDKSLLRPRPAPLEISVVQNTRDIDVVSPPASTSEPPAKRPPPPRSPAAHANDRADKDIISPPRPASPPVPALLRASQRNPFEDHLSPSDLQVQSSPPISKPAPKKRSPVKSKPPERPPSPPVPAHKSHQQQQAPLSPRSDPILGGSILPPGFDAPEPIPDHLAVDFALPIDAFGPLLIRCLLGRQFGLREWAMGEMIGKVEERGKEPGKGDNTMDINSFVDAVFQIVQSSLDDSREKAITGAVSLLEKVHGLCTNQRVPPAVIFRHFDTIVPLLLAKAGDMNPRACSDIIITLVKSYNESPFTIYPYALRPPESKKGATPHWKVFKGRLDLLHQLIDECGLDDSEGRGKARGASLQSIMEFTQPQLQHTNVEVREAAVRVVVDLMQASGEDAITPYLKKVKPQLMDSIRSKLAEAKGTPVKRVQKARPARPWERSPSKPAGPAAQEEGAEEVKKLQNELKALRQMADSPPVQSKGKVGDKRRVTSTSSNGSTGGKLGNGAHEKKGIRSDDKMRKSRSVDGVEGLANSLKSERRVGKTASVPPPARDAPKPKPGGKTKAREPPAPAPTRKNEALYSNNWNIDRTCIFCEEQDEGFTEENLDMHYWRDCPVLTNCPLCKLIVEVPMLTDHLLKDCDKKKDVRQCPRCKEAFKTVDFAAHTAKKSCRVLNHNPDLARCPMCHQDVPSDEEGWRQHLVTGTGCPGSERKPKDPSHYPAFSTMLPDLNSDVLSSGGLARSLQIPLSEPETKSGASSVSPRPTDTTPPPKKGLFKRAPKKEQQTLSKSLSTPVSNLKSRGGLVGSVKSTVRRSLLPRASVEDRSKETGKGLSMAR